MPDQEGLTWLEIDDFTPGIITNSALAYAPTTNGNTGSLSLGFSNGLATYLAYSAPS